MNIPHLPCNYALFSVHVCVWLICADSLSPISLFSMIAIVDLAKEPTAPQHLYLTQCPLALRVSMTQERPLSGFHQNMNLIFHFKRQ